MEATDILYFTDISENGTDEDGNIQRIETTRAVYCDVQSVNRSEFYYASKSDFRPQYIVTVHSFEYLGESSCKLRGERYSIIRSYSTVKNGFRITELTLQRKASDVNDND